MIKKSPRFLFLGSDVEAVAIGPDSYKDVFSGPADGGAITASGVGGQVWIYLPGRDEPYETSMAWPGPGEHLLEIAPAVLEAVVQADPNQSDNVLRQLRHEVEAYMSAVNDQHDNPPE
ncbi:hypothetical protein [Phytohabitans rumicis]|nr:hypothetical protein [Phytohabitans rumicis]